MPIIDNGQIAFLEFELNITKAIFMNLFVRNIV